MFYTIYKITNKINGKFYIGKHQTKNLNDGYMGSGKLIRNAIQKYGKENFSKEILHVFDSEEEMNAKEKELVVVSEMSYNLCDGGNGGFGYINNSGLAPRIFRDDKVLQKEASRKGNECLNLLRSDTEWMRRYKQKLSAAAKSNPSRGFKNKKHTSQTKQLISRSNSESQRGRKNSQYGTIWITDGFQNRKVNKSAIIPIGWYAGRILRKEIL